MILAFASLVVNGWLALISTLISVILLLGSFRGSLTIPATVYFILALFGTALTIVPSVIGFHQVNDEYNKRNTHIIETVLSLDGNPFMVSDPVEYTTLTTDLPIICGGEISTMRVNLTISMKDVIPSVNSNLYSIFANVKKSPKYNTNCADGFEKLRKIMPEGKLSEFEQLVNTNKK